MGLVYVRSERYEQAEPLLLKAYQLRQQRLGDLHPDTQAILRRLVRLYDAWGKAQEAEKWRAKLPTFRTVPTENLELLEGMQACAENMKKIHAAIRKYRVDKGKPPDWLSDLVPDYLTADTLFCPNDETHKAQFSLDPKLPCSYSWQFSPGPIPEGWDPTGKISFRQWRTQQSRLFGDIVPIVRCHYHGDDKVLSLSTGGQIFWAPVAWEFMFRPGYRFGDERNPSLLEQAKAAGVPQDVNQP